MRFLEFGAWILLFGGAVYTGFRMVRQFRDAAPQSKLIRNVDRFYTTQCPAGNIFIRFDGLNAERDGAFVFVQFVRASYAIHPRRVYVAAPDHLHLCDSAMILQHNQLPSAAWLNEHGVRYVVTFSVVAGRPAVHVRRTKFEN